MKPATTIRCLCRRFFGIFTIPNKPKFLGGGRWFGQQDAASGLCPLRRGTESSNPTPSTGDSYANLWSYHRPLPSEKQARSPQVRRSHSLRACFTECCRKRNRQC